MSICSLDDPLSAESKTIAKEAGNFMEGAGEHADALNKLGKSLEAKYIGRDLYKGEIYELTTSGVAPDLENVIRRNTMTLDITPEEAMSLLPDQILSRSGSKIRININFYVRLSLLNYLYQFQL